GAAWASSWVRRKGGTRPSPPARWRLGQDDGVYIVVIGAGEVGSYVAERLSREGHDVAVVEADAGRLHELEHRLDVLTVVGSGSHPQVLDAAGVAKADVTVAVSSSDEVNLLASWLAKQAGSKQTVVRLQSPELRGREAQPLRAAAG